MIRLFKHYIPHAVLLLGLLDLGLLILASEAAWQLRASQIGMEPVVETIATMGIGQHEQTLGNCRQPGFVDGIEAAHLSKYWDWFLTSCR